MSDLAADMVNSGVTEFGMKNAATEIRNNASSENPFLPPSGEILKTAIRWTEKQFYVPPKHEKIERKAAPYCLPDALPWSMKKYQEVKDLGLMPQVLEHIENKLQGQKRADYIKYLVNMCDFPSNFA